jgi:hypothetical protein
MFADQIIDFDEKSDNVIRFLHKAKPFLEASQHLKFRLVNADNSIAYGDGADREVYNRIFKEIVKVNGYFGQFCLEPNLLNVFNCEDLMKTLATVVYEANFAGYIPPFHFEPWLLGELTDADYEFYFKIKFPETFSTVSKLSNDEFIATDLGFESKIAYYRSMIIKPNEIPEIQLFTDKLRSLFGTNSVIELDRILSGNYVLRLADIINMFSYETDSEFPFTSQIGNNVSRPELRSVCDSDVTTTELSTYWESFLATLCEDELKQLLMTIGGTISISAFYKIVCRSNSPGIKISTCFGFATINPIFIKEKIDLKSYFILAKDNIRDNHTIGIFDNPIDRMSARCSQIGTAGIVVINRESVRNAQIGTIANPALQRSVIYQIHTENINIECELHYQQIIHDEFINQFYENEIRRCMGLINGRITSIEHERQINTLRDECRKPSKTKREIISQKQRLIKPTSNIPTNRNSIKTHNKNIVRVSKGKGKSKFHLFNR